MLGTAIMGIAMITWFTLKGKTGFPIRLSLSLFLFIPGFALFMSNYPFQPYWPLLAAATIPLGWYLVYKLLSWQCRAPSVGANPKFRPALTDEKKGHRLLTQIQGRR